jgi:hypothetical protein
MRTTITIKEPATDTAVDLIAETEDYNGELGWRILFPDKDSFIMVQKDGEWNVMDEENINPELVEAIAKALTPHDRYTSMTGNSG